jgi:hypothetical protein
MGRRKVVLHGAPTKREVLKLRPGDHVKAAGTKRGQFRKDGKTTRRSAKP